MKKLRGAANNKTIIGVVIALVVLAGSYFAYGKLGKDNPKVELKDAFLGVITEFHNTANDLTPGLGESEMSKKILDNGAFDLDMNVNTELLASMGIDKAGINLKFKQNNKAKKAEFEMEANLGNLSTLSLNTKFLGDEIYLDAPFAYDKAFKINAKTLGADLETSALATLMNIDTEEAKNLSIDLFGNAKTFAEQKKEFFAFVKTEQSTLVKNMNITKVETDKVTSEKLAQTDLEQFSIEVNSADLKAYLNKSIDFVISVNEKQIESIAGTDSLMNSDFQSQIDSLKQTKTEIENAELKEKVTLKATLNKDGKLVAFNLPNFATDAKEKEVMNVYLAGKKNTTDDITVEFSDELDTFTMTYKMVAGESQNTSDFLISENDETMFSFSSTYSPADKSFTGAFSLIDYYSDETTNLSLKGKYEDVVEGVSYNQVIDNLTINVPYQEPIVLSGNIKMSVEAPEITAPENSTEILKLTKEELNSLETEIMTNVESSLMPLMAVMYGL